MAKLRALAKQRHLYHPLDAASEREGAEKQGKGAGRLSTVAQKPVEEEEEEDEEEEDVDLDFDDDESESEAIACARAEGRWTGPERPPRRAAGVRAAAAAAAAGAAEAQPGTAKEKEERGKEENDSQQNMLSPRKRKLADADGGGESSLAVDGVDNGQSSLVEEVDAEEDYLWEVINCGDKCDYPCTKTTCKWERCKVLSRSNHRANLRMYDGELLDNILFKYIRRVGEQTSSSARASRSRATG